MYGGDAVGILETGRWCGIDRIAMMSWNGPCCTDAQDGNDVVWRAMERFGNKVIGVATIDPSHMSSAEMEAEIRLRYLEQGFVGMKPYPSMALKYDDDAFSPWWEFGNEHHLYALMHASPATGGTASISNLAERFPEVSWLMAHSGRTWDYAEEVAECIREHPNVYAEITYTAVTNRVLEYLVDATDEDHVIFGTDAPMRDPRPQLGWVIWADLPAEARKKILAGNFERIVGRAH
jgi:predicted TIM-barrel fold metal-dependent hydrolase